jgi:hypothetical protein
MRRLETAPGVQSVSLSKTTLIWPGSGDARIRLPEQTFSKPEDQRLVPLHEVAPRIFETLRIRLIQGREFNEGDGPRAPRVVIINETLAKLMWPDGQPVERLLVVNDQPTRVVGVVRDAQIRSVSRGAVTVSLFAVLAKQSQPTGRRNH